MEGAVPSVAIQLSKKDLEEGTLFASKQIKTVTKLHEAFFGPTLVVNKGEVWITAYDAVSNIPTICFVYALCYDS